MPIAFIAISFELSKFCLLLSLINDRTVLMLIIIIYLWGKYLPLNNYLPLIKILTVNEIH